MIKAGTKSPTSGDTFTKTIQSIVDSISSKVIELAQAIGEKFDSSSLLSLGDLLGSIAEDVLSDFIDAIGSIIRAFLEVMGDVVDLFDRLGNAK
jgi:hypothetical protein